MNTTNFQKRDYVEVTAKVPDQKESFRISSNQKLLSNDSIGSHYHRPFSVIPDPVITKSNMASKKSMTDNINQPVIDTNSRKISHKKRAHTHDTFVAHRHAF